MMKKRAYLYAVVAIAVAAAAVIIVSYTLFGQGSPQLGQGGQAQEIVPASYTGAACPAGSPGFYSTVTYLKVVKALSLYNISNQPAGFLIAPGDTGVISFKVSISKILFGQPNVTLKVPILNVSNYISLAHVSHEIVNLTITEANSTVIKYKNGTVIFNGVYGTIIYNKSILSEVNKNVTIANGSTIIFPNGTKITFTKNISFDVLTVPVGKTTIISYQGCTTVYLSGGGKEIGCRGVPKSAPHNVSVGYTNYTHPGVNITLQPEHELLTANQSIIVNATVSVAPNATYGTYLLGIHTSKEYCEGLFALLTIGYKPYDGTNGIPNIIPP